MAALLPAMSNNKRRYNVIQCTLAHVCTYVRLDGFTDPSRKCMHVCIYYVRLYVCVSFGILGAGHTCILRKAYNCTERKEISDLQNMEISFKENLSFPIEKISDDLFFIHPKILIFSISSTKNSDDFFSHFLRFLFYSAQTHQVQLHNLLFSSFILNSSHFSLFYNCTNCHQLNVNICPAFYNCTNYLFQLHISILQLHKL